MAIPEVPLSCCCDWGTGRIGSVPPNVWYISEGNVLVGTSRLEKAALSDGDTIAFETFTDAARIQAMATISAIPCFYTYASPTAVKKYDETGTLDWTYSAGAGISNSVPGGVQNFTHKIAAGAGGNLYLVASTTAGPQKMVVNKIDGSGSEAWTTQTSNHTNPSNNYFGLFVAENVDGKVVGVGTGGITYFDTDGTELWNDTQTGMKACFDSSGNVYVLSNTSPPSVWVYDNTGSFLFSVSLTGASNIVFTDIEVFDSKLYTCWHNSTSSKVFLQRRSDSTLSTVDWAIEIPYTNTMRHDANACPRIAVDSSGDLYATYGTIDGLSNRFGFITRRLAADGSEVYSVTRTGECLFPMIPPGRPPLFI